MKRVYLNIIAFIVIVSLLTNNAIFALAPDTKLSPEKFGRVVTSLFQVLSELKTEQEQVPLTHLFKIRDRLRVILGDTHLGNNLELSLDSKNKIIYLYSNTPRSTPGVIYKIHASNNTALNGSTKPIFSENIGELNIEVYTRTTELEETIQALTHTTNIELSADERALLHEFIRKADSSLAIELIQKLLPKEDFALLPSSILEINARAWGKRFRDIDEAELKRIKGRGFDSLWLMGIWEISPESARINHGPNRVGSAYAIMDYKINPDLGTEEDFIEFSKRAKNAGISVIVDFIPNHMAKDSPLISEHPDWFMPWWGNVSEDDRNKRNYSGKPYFYEHTSGRIIAYGSSSWDLQNDPWIDTAQLNLANAKLRQHLIETLKKIARITQSGGVRCDMAMAATRQHIKGMWFGFTSQADFDRLMPREFWEEIITEVRKEYPDFQFIAEAYWQTEGYLQQLGFSATYDKYFYDLLARGDIRELRDYLNRAPKDYLAKTIHFLANHDERNPQDVFIDNSEYRAAAVIAGVVPGLLLYYLDQVEGRNQISTATYIPDRKDIKQNRKIKEFFDQLAPIFLHPVFRKGGFSLINVNGEKTDNIFACQREYKDTSALALVNYSKERVSFTIDSLKLDLEIEYLLADLITKEKRLVKGKDIKEHQFDLAPFGYKIFTLVPIEKLQSQEVRLLRDKRLIGFKPRGPPEDRLFYGYTNEVPNVVIGSVLKIDIPEKDFSTEVEEGAIPEDGQAEKIALEIAHFKYVMDYILIPFYEKKRDKAKLDGDKDKAGVYDAYVNILEGEKTDIGGGLYGVTMRVGKIEEQKKTAVSILKEKYEKVKSTKEKIKDAKFIGIMAEMEFMLIEIIEHLQEHIYIAPLSLQVDRAKVIENEIGHFTKTLSIVEKEFEIQNGAVAGLIEKLERDVPGLIRDREFRARRAIFEVVENMELAGDETIVIKKFIDRLIEELEIIEKTSLKGDIIVVLSNVPHPVKLERLKDKLGPEVNVKAILCDKGTPISHFSVFAAQEGIPAISGTHDELNKPLFNQVRDGEQVVVLGFNGKIIKNPSQAVLVQLPNMILEERALHEYIKESAKEDAVTQNGTNIKVLGNADRTHQIKNVINLGGNGIGLVRTEYLYDRTTLPTIEELSTQFETLALLVPKDKKTVIRVFDKQPDKKMKCLPKSQWSGFQYYINDEFGRQAVRNELKALFLAFLKYPNIRLMFPQVSTPEDVDFAIALIREVKDELVSEKQVDRAVLDKMEIGFMVETSAAVANIRYLLKYADFVSIGSNDLTKLTFNIDRDDEMAIQYIMRLQPVILKYIYDVVAAVREVNRGILADKPKKEVSICGDIAKLPKFLAFLLAISDKETQLVPSMPSRFIPLAKELIRSLDISECRAVFSEVIKGNIGDAGDIDNVAQDLVQRNMEEIKEREGYRRALERVLREQMGEGPSAPEEDNFSKFYNMLKGLIGKEYPFIKWRSDTELKLMLENKTERPNLLAVLKEDGVVGMGELKVIGDLALLVQKAAEGIEISQEWKTLIVEILAADILSSMSQMNLRNGNWQEDKNIPVLSYNVPINKGIIIQKFSDIFGNLKLTDGKAEFNQLSPGLKEWLAMIKEHYTKWPDIKFGFVIDNLDEAKKRIFVELLEKYTGLDSGTFYIGGNITDITLQADTENFVYLGNFGYDEKEQLKKDRIKFIQKNNAGLPIELNLCLRLLDLRKNEVYDKDGRLTSEVLALYISFGNSLAENGLVSKAAVKEMISEVKRDGIIKLPEIKEAGEILRGIEEERESISLSV